MPDLSVRPAPGSPVSGPFGRLTWLELMVLSAKVRRGKRRCRLAAFHAVSLSQVRSLLRLAGQLADLEDEIEQELACR